MQHNNFPNTQQFPPYFQPPINFQQNRGLFQNSAQNPTRFSFDSAQPNYSTNDYNYHHLYMNQSNFTHQNDPKSQLSHPYPNAPPYFPPPVNQHYYPFQQTPQFGPPSTNFSPSKKPEHPYSSSTSPILSNPLIIQNNPPRLTIPSTAAQPQQIQPASPSQASPPIKTSNQSDLQQPKQSKSSKRHKKVLLNAKKLQDTNSFDRHSPNALAERQRESWGWTLPDFDRKDVSASSMNFPKNTNDIKYDFSGFLSNQHKMTFSESSQNSPSNYSGFLSNTMQPNNSSNSTGFLSHQINIDSMNITQTHNPSNYTGFLSNPSNIDSTNSLQANNPSNYTGFLSNPSNSNDFHQNEINSRSNLTGFLSDPRNLDSSSHPEEEENEIDSTNENDSNETILLNDNDSNEPQSVHESDSDSSSSEDQPNFDPEYYEQHQIKRILYLWDTLF